MEKNNLNNRALISKIDNISIQMWSIAKETENENEAHKFYASEILKNMSFQLDSLVEMLNAKSAEIEAYEKSHTNQ